MRRVPSIREPIIRPARSAPPVITCAPESARCRIKESAWHLHGRSAMGFDAEYP
jgi:hypothetical protein